MNGRRSATLRWAVLGLALSAALFVLVDGASAQSTEVGSDRVVQSLNKCGLGKETPNFHVLFLLDESGSLKWNDPANKRVDGTLKALDALQQLATRYSGIPINIDVAIDGFAQDYRTRTEWSPLGEPGSVDTLKADAEKFRNRIKGSQTDYREAIRGAGQAFADREESGEEGCKALVWFTDGEYDTEPRTDNYLSSTEIDEISNELCAANGPVDQLRASGITVIAIGLSNKEADNPPDMTLVRAIASGNKVNPQNEDLVLPDDRCGTRPGTGDLYETTDPDELIEKFGEILGDSLFETVEVKPPPLPCTSEAEICTVEFELGPWVDRFTAYFKLPPRTNGRGLTASLDPPGVDTAPVDITYPKGALPGLPGLEGESPSRSWRKLTGTAEDASDIWNGVWQIHFEGPGAAEAKANLEFIEGNLEVLLDQRTLDRTDPDTFGTIRIGLRARGQTFRCNDTRYPIILEFTGSMGGQSARPASKEFRADEQCFVPAGFLLDLLTAGPARDASSVEFEVTPSLRAVADDVVPPLEFEPSPVLLILENALVAELTEGSRLDRTDPATFESVKVELKAGGRMVGCSPTGRYPIILEFTGKRGDLPPVTASGEFEAGQPCIVPSTFLEDLVNTGPGKDALSATFDVTPSLEVEGKVLAFPSSTVSIWLEDALVVELAEGSRLDRTVPASFNGVGLELFLGDQRFEPSEGTRVILEFSADLSGRLDASGTYGGDQPFTVPSGFLREALQDGAGRHLLRFTFEVTPEVIVAAGEDPGRHPSYEPSTIHIWLHDPMEIRRVDAQELDREDPNSYAGVGVDLLVAGQPLSDGRARVAIDYTTKVGGDVVSTSQSYPPGGPYVIPFGFFDDAFQAAGDSNLLNLAVSATPTLTIDGRAHPGYAPSLLQFAVRAGEGFPTVVSATATDFDDTENSTLTVVIRGPDDGTGTLEIRSISGLPTDLPGTITLIKKKTCDEIPSREIVRCEVELEASFTANRTIELDVDLAISGDRTKVPGHTKEASVAVKPFKMTRPLNPVSFITKLLTLLALFVAVQTVLRVLYTTRLARWEAAETGSRRASLPARITPEGMVTAEAGGHLRIEPTATLFATELETAGSSAHLDDLGFRISWWRTFIGERQGSGLIRYQRPTIRVSSPDAHCVAPEGCDLDTKDRFAMGKVGTGFLRCWVLQIPDEALRSLADGESATGRLLVVLLPAEMKDFDEQMEEIRDVISDVTGRELPRLVEWADPRPEGQAGPSEEGEGGPPFETPKPGADGPSQDGQTTVDDDSDWGDPRDPLASGVPDPSTEASDTKESGSWASGPDDPLA